MMSVTHSEYSKSRKLWKMIKCAIFHKINNYFLSFFNGLEFNRPITKKDIGKAVNCHIIYASNTFTKSTYMYIEHHTYKLCTCIASYMI